LAAQPAIIIGMLIAAIATIAAVVADTRAT